MKNAVLNRKKEIAQLKNAIQKHKGKIELLNASIIKLEKLRKIEQVELNKNYLDEISKLTEKIQKITENMGEKIV